MATFWSVRRGIGPNFGFEPRSMTVRSYIDRTSIILANPSCGSAPEYPIETRSMDQRRLMRLFDNSTIPGHIKPRMEPGPQPIGLPKIEILGSRCYPWKQ